jgi:hypothetical protein
MTTHHSQERWLPRDSPRNNPAPPLHPHRYSIAESTRSTYTSTLAFDRFKHLNSCTFNVPTSDDGIRADTHEGVLQYPLPNERDDYTIVRRYLYNILTVTGFGIGEKYPAAVRCTVEAWYGDGAFFRAKCEEDGPRGLCPEDGKDDHGVDIWFHEIIGRKIDECVRSESRKSLQRDREWEEGVSVAASYTGVVAHEEQGMRAPDDAITNENLPQDQRSLHSSDCSVYSREEEEEDNAKPLGLPDRHDSARSSTVKPNTSTSEELAASYMDLVSSSLETEHLLDAGTSPTTDEHHPEEPSLHESLPDIPDEETQVMVEKPSMQQDLKTETIVPKRSFIKRVTSVKNFALRPTFSSKEVGAPNALDKRPGGYKQVRVGYTADTEAKPRVSPDMIRTMDELMQGRRSTHLKRAPTKKGKKSLGDGVGVGVKAPQPTPNIKTPPQTPEEAKRPGQQEEAEVAAAIAAALRARQMKVEEARRLNHHAERKKAGFFAKMFDSMGGKKKYCAGIQAHTPGVIKIQLFSASNERAYVRTVN